MDEMSWEEWVDAHFATIKVCFHRVPPYPDNGKGKDKYLVSHIMPADAFFYCERVAGIRDWDKDALAVALWHRLYSTEEGRKMLVDAFLDSLAAATDIEATAGTFEDADEDRLQVWDVMDPDELIRFDPRTGEYHRQP